MSQPAKIEKLEARVTKLETQMADVHRLASGASHDVSTVEVRLRAHEKQLNVLRETQVEHGQRLDRLERKVDSGFAKMDANFAKINGNFAQVNENFVNINGKFAEIDGKFARIDENFTQIDGKFAQVDANFATVNEKLENLHTGQQKIIGLLTDRSEEN